MSVSLKVLRKIRGDDDALFGSIEDDEELEPAPFYTKPSNNQVNRYDLLNDGSPSDSEVKDDDDDDTEKIQNLKVNNENVRKKKKKKKRKNLPTVQKQCSDDIDEVERSVREVNAILGDASPRAAPSTKAVLLADVSILAVDKNYLNPKIELKSIFGAEAVKEYHVNKGSRSRRHLRNFLLVPHLERLTEAYSQSGPFLSMCLVSVENGIQYFKFEHSANYQAVERKFLASITSLDPLQLMTNVYPFHVNSLIHLSELCKMNEDYPAAAQFIERTLFALEVAFHPRFNLAKGNCRLDYRRQENRCLFIALFNHLRYIGQRGCYRTALELCKALLSLSPDDDPMAVVLIIEFYALRSGQYKWLLDFIEDGEAKRNLSQLPNMAFGRAIAHLQLQEVEKADQLLQEALIMFPGVLLKLLEKCCISPDPQTKASSFFLDAFDRQSPALKQLIQLYVGRSYHLWKEATVVRWLERNTVSVLERLKRNDPLIADSAAKRSKRFDCKTPQPVQRHILLSDITDVPVTELGSTFNYDPIPPTNSIDIYKEPERPQRYDVQGNFFSLFFRSFLPNYGQEPAQQVQQQNEEEHVEIVPEEEEGAENARGGELRRSVHTLLDAVRELITNMQVEIQPDSASSDRDGDSDDENHSDS